MKKKAWDEDLIIGGIELAVKTQKRSAAKRYGASWTLFGIRHKEETQF